MPDKVRVVYRADGGVSIIHPAPKSRREGETEADWLERVFTKSMHGDLKGRPYDDVMKATLPPDRSSRDAWEGSKGQGITVNASKAAQQRVDREKAGKIDVEMRLLAEQSLIAKGEL